MNILIVKLSSLGDVLHNLPIVWDLRASYPQAHIDWVVEEGYVDLLEPLKTTDHFKGLDRIIPFGLRRWKKDLKKGEFIKSIQEFLEFKKNLQAVTYDLVIETQGLIKSAFVTRLTKRKAESLIFGLANQTEFSGYEPFARRFYTDCVHVPFHCHAVDRSRIVATAAMNIPVPDRVNSAPQFYPSSFVDHLKSYQFEQFKKARDFGFNLDLPYVLCFHSTAREAKRWSHSNWIEVGKFLAKEGLQVIFPWGNQKEKEISELLVAEISKSIQDKAIVPKNFSIQECFPLIAGARLCIGVDTGLTHLSAILNQRTVELYCDSPRWKTEGYWNPHIHNLGDIGQPPELSEVISSLKDLLKSS